MLRLAISLGPLVPWTIRNWRTFGVFQPLASRHAEDPGEFVPMGFNHWMKTWVVDFVSVDEVFWHVSGEAMSINALAEGAFDLREEDGTMGRVIATDSKQLYIDTDLDLGFDI